VADGRPGLAFLLAACGTEQPEALEPCGSTAPDVVEVHVSDCGLHTFPDDEGTHPGLLIEAQVSDPDGDLQSYGMRIFWDDVVDGVVEPTGPFYDLQGAFDDAERCEVFEATLGMWVSVTKNDDTPEFGAETELGVVVEDEVPRESDGLVLLTAVMPSEDGSCSLQ
jgi:hypothetical protein